MQLKYFFFPMEFYCHFSIIFEIKLFNKISNKCNMTAYQYAEKEQYTQICQLFSQYNTNS